MKKALSLILLLGVLAALFAGCGEKTPEAGGTTAPSQTAETTSPAQTAETTEPTEPEKFISGTIISEGTSEYVIVHDGDYVTSKLAKLLQTRIANAYGAQLPVKAASEGENTHEILIGACRKVSDKTMKKLNTPFDFALKVEENALVLCAANEFSYKYLEEYLIREVFTENEAKTLELDSNDNLFYTQSDLMQYNYIDYLAAEGKTFVINDVFDWGIYENADTRLPYRIYIPFNYTPEKQYPIIVNLHGAGLRGDDNVKQMTQINKPMGNPELTVDDAIIICPQCPENQKWVDSSWGIGSYSLQNVPESNELRAVVELVKQLQETYSVDAGRIYACGFSMGGYGTWNLLMNHPDLFCAGIPMCGAGDPGMAQTLKDIPVWAVHGGMDPTVPVQGSRDMATALEKVGSTVYHYTELADHEHDVWNYTYESTEIFAWLMEQHK